MKNWLRDNAKRMLLISLVLMIVSMIATNIIQTNGGTIEVKTISLESISGHTLSAKLFIPENATEETPAPTVVYAHGWYNNKENGDMFAIEYARRGYVVMTIDMYSHGNSENLTNTETAHGAYGLYDACFYVSSLPYVDSTKIIASGHSAGSNAVSKAVVIDNEKQTNLIAGCLLISYDPVVMDTSNGNKDTFGVKVGSNGEYNNIYGSRDTALIAGRYDDYFFTVKDNNVPQTATRDYVATTMAKAFVTCGKPDTFEGDAVVPGNWYTSTIDGKETVRIIYTPSTIHAQTWFSSETAAAGINFLQSRFPTGISIDENEQIWQIKTLFNAIGLIGFWMFLAFFAIALLDCRCFEQLKNPIAMRKTAGKTDLIWSLGTSAIKIAISIAIIWTIMNSTMYSRIDPIWKQKNTFCIAAWAAYNGVVILATVFAWYFCYAKKTGVDLRETGLILPKKDIAATIGIAFVTVVCAWWIVFFADYFFQTDFRFWQWSIKAFPAYKIKDTLAFLPLFLLFFIANSIAINVQGYSSTLSKNENLNLLILALLNCLAPLLIIIVQYTTFVSTGFQKWGVGAMARIPTWLHTAVLILFITPYITRAIYKRTRNLYIGGIINAILVLLCMCMNSTTLLGA